MLETQRLILREVWESDADDLYTYCREPSVGPAAGWKPHESLLETREIMREFFLGQKDVFAMVLRRSGRVIGTVGLTGDPKRAYPQAKMLGYAMSEDHWGQGLMTEAAAAVLAHGFENPDTLLISAYCYPFNARSRRVLEKCGFSYEGRLSFCERRYDGVFLDHLCFSLTKDRLRLDKTGASV